MFTIYEMRNQRLTINLIVMKLIFKHHMFRISKIDSEYGGDLYKIEPIHGHLPEFDKHTINRVWFMEGKVYYIFHNEEEHTDEETFIDVRIPTVMREDQIIMLDK